MDDEFFLGSVVATERAVALVFSDIFGWEDVVSAAPKDVKIPATVKEAPAAAWLNFIVSPRQNIFW